MSKEQARLCAMKVLDAYADMQMPLDVVLLASKLGYEVKQANFKKDWISGGVNFFDNADDKQKGVIYVRAKEPPRRQRFTIAHEIGHCVMHRDIHKNGILENIDMFRNPNNHSPEEVEANEFAANILMPEDLVRTMWWRWGSTEILASIFKVSLSAISYRLYNLGLKEDW